MHDRPASERDASITGAEHVQWDLSDLYRGIEDPQLDADLELLLAKAASFGSRHRGTLKDTLGAALSLQAEIASLASQVMGYLELRRSTDATNSLIQQRLGRFKETWSRAEADHLNFFEHELGTMQEAVYQALLARDPVVLRHRSLLDYLRANHRYLLEENVERALVLRSPFGPSEWRLYLDEREAELRFPLADQSLTLPQIVNAVNHHPHREHRAAALAAFSSGLRERGFDRLMARTLNVVMGAKAVEDQERRYASPMASRNIANRVDDATVEALHQAVAKEGAWQARRYYRLLSDRLGIKPLAWSDRNAKLPFVGTRIVAWADCVETVLAAYDSFSHELYRLVRTMLDRRWVDAPTYPGKTGGAYNFSLILPSEEPRSYIFLNYQGSTHDVMTVAHEAGHGAHGMLAARAQGALMFRAPMALAETASIFGEMTTFRFLLERAQSDRERLALLLEKCSDHINSVVRQISFSQFEQRLHARRREVRLGVAEINGIWMEVTQEYYGPEGDLFNYAHAENLWCYVTHFLHPFYVYAYAFGELFTQSLFAVQERFGKSFEPMYLDLLRAGSTQSAVELMKPFGLDPREPDFWVAGIRGSIGRWLDEAEAIAQRL